MELNIKQHDKLGGYFYSQLGKKKNNENFQEKQTNKKRHVSFIMRCKSGITE